jgi:poly(beta-D-mannuronate) C5 epimerase
MHTAKGVPDMNNAKKGSLTLLAGAMLLASAAAFANVEPAKVEPAAPQPGKPATLAKELQQAKTYTVSSAPTAPLELATPKLPKPSPRKSCAARPARSAYAG